MIGSFWRTRPRCWFSAPRPEDENSTDGELSPSQRRSGGEKSPLVEFSPPLEVSFRSEPRTPGPGAAWSGGRL
jgi:hypothetical protein